MGKFTEEQMMAMSSRLLNGLRDGNIHSLEEAAKRTPQELLEIRNIGRKALYELQVLFKAYQIPWAFKIPTWEEENKIMLQTIPPKWAAAFLLRSRGMTYKQIGEYLEVNTSRARGLAWGAELRLIGMARGGWGPKGYPERDRR